MGRFSANGTRERGLQSRQGPAAMPTVRTTRQVLLPLLFGAPLLTGCPTGFVDSTPPELETVERTFQVPPVTAPVVYQLIFDVHLANPSDCTAVIDRVTASARAALLPAGSVGAELPLYDLTGGTCHQQADRTIDAYWIADNLAGPEATWGTAKVRPLLLYLNNVDLELPWGVKSGIYSLIAEQDARGAPPPLLWGIVSEKARKDAAYERASAWTYAQDPALFNGIAGFAQSDLPLQMSGTIGSVPLFTNEESARFLQFKGCRADARIQGVNFAFNGMAQALQVAALPQIEVAQTNPFPVSRPKYNEKPAVAVAEGCTAHCNRFISTSSGLDRWDFHYGCALTSGPAL
jgi:hypothetical protein